MAVGEGEWAFPQELRTVSAEAAPCFPALISGGAPLFTTVTIRSRCLRAGGQGKETVSPCPALSVRRPSRYGTGAGWPHGSVCSCVRGSQLSPDRGPPWGPQSRFRHWRAEGLSSVSAESGRCRRINTRCGRQAGGEAIDQSPNGFFEQVGVTPYWRADPQSPASGLIPAPQLCRSTAAAAFAAGSRSVRARDWLGGAALQLAAMEDQAEGSICSLAFAVDSGSSGAHTAGRSCGAAGSGSGSGSWQTGVRTRG